MTSPRRLRCHSTVCALALLLPASLQGIAATLTIPRLFAAPDLAGDSLRSPAISPDGTLVAYLKGAADNRDRLDLWAYDIATGKHRRLIDARALAPETGTLDAEEAARRERQRTSSLSGILEYTIAPDSKSILVPLAGDLYLYDTTATPDHAVRRLTLTPAYETDARFSPRGRYVSFIREQNLIVLDLRSGREIAITHGAGGTQSFGMAEFIAQEEMNRDTGYWWAPDESRIAFTRVDDAAIAETERFEINARSVAVVRQRYPFTGGPNATVELYVAPLAAPTAAVRMQLGNASDGYLPRVAFFPDGKSLAVQRQSRDQKTLELLRADVTTGIATVLITEHSATWVPLHSELTFLPRHRQLIWGSSRSGLPQLYLYDWQGRLVRRLTDAAHPAIGNKGGAALRAVDERRGLLYFLSPGVNPRERQLYRLSLDRPGRVQPLTHDAGWHGVVMADDARVFLDAFSNSETPPQLRLHAADGRLLKTLVSNALTEGHPYFPYLADHARSEFGTLTADDGQTLHFALLKPAHMVPGKRYPVVLDVYGGPGVQNVTNSWGGTWGGFHQILTQAGYVVFMLDNRGSGARGERFEAALYHHLGTVEVADQVTGVRYLRSLSFVDGERIGVLGWSYGGFMALHCVLQHPEDFAAAVSGAPVTDWRLYDTHYTERYLGTPAENPEGYAGADVTTRAANLARPLLLIHGMADDNVLFTHSTAMMRALQNADRPFELMTYPGGKHGLTRHQDDGPHAFAQILRFFDQTLKR